MRQGIQIARWLKNTGIALTLVLMASAQASALDLSNTAHATGTAPGGAPVISADDTVDIPVISAIRSMTVSKSGVYSDTDGKLGFTAGDTVAWSVTVANTGNVTISTITLTDALVSLVCPVSGNNTIASIAPLASVNCTASYAVTQADIDTNGGGDGDIDNSASASGSAPGAGGPVTAAGAASVPVTQSPAVTIVKTAYVGGLPPILGGSGITPVPANRPVGTVISYVYVISNTGNTTATNMVVADVHNGLGAPVVPATETGVVTTGGSTDAVANASWDFLRPGDQIAFSANYTLTQDDVDQRQ